eukprot:581036-Rhodomonas_salina.1
MGSQSPIPRRRSAPTKQLPWAGVYVHVVVDILDLTPDEYASKTENGTLATPQSYLVRRPRPA